MVMCSKLFSNKTSVAFLSLWMFVRKVFKKWYQNNINYSIYHKTYISNITIPMKKLFKTMGRGIRIEAYWVIMELWNGVRFPNIPDHKNNSLKPNLTQLLVASSSRCLYFRMEQENCIDCYSSANDHSQNSLIPPLHQ